MTGAGRAPAGVPPRRRTAVVADGGSAAGQPPARHPLAARSSPLMTDLDPPPPPHAPAPRGRAPRVLLVDDEAVIRHALRRFLQRQGWEVDEAADGATALQRLLADGADGAGGADAPGGAGAERGGAVDAVPPGAPHDLIICDLRMPGLSGMELHARLAAERPALLSRLLFTTGDATSPEAAAFLARAGVPVLVKPFELAELRAVLARVRPAG